MIRINLLPYRAARKKENVRNQILIFVLSLMSVIAILGYYHFHLSGTVKDLNTQLKKTKAQVEKYNKIVAEVEKIREKMAVVEKKLGVIENLNMNRRDAVHLLDTMTNMVIENRMWFTYFESIEKTTITIKTVTETIEKDGKKKKKQKKVEEKNVSTIVKIEGIALDNKTVADFMTHIENAKGLGGGNMFRDVKLATLYQVAFEQGKDKPSINLKGFKVTCLKVPLKTPDTSEAKK